MNSHFDNQNHNYGYPPNYEQNPYNQNHHQFQNNQIDPELEKRAREIKTLGIGSIILSTLCMCCCPFMGLITGIIGLVKVNELQSYFGMLSSHGLENVHVGKACSIIGIALGWIGFIINLFLQYDGFYDSF